MAIVARKWSATLIAGSAAAAFTVWAGGADSQPSGSPPAAIPARVAKTPNPPSPLVGDADLEGKLQLGKMHREGDRFLAPLSGGGEAVLTLEPDLQSAAESVLERAKAPMGAIVVTGIDGKVLAFAGRRNQEPALENDFSLCVKAWAPAASVFKIVTGAALLSKGVKPTTKVCYHGGIRSVDPSHLVDNPKRDRDCQSLSFGVAKSQNAIIAKLANRHLDKQALVRFAKRFGFDHELPFAVKTEEYSCSIPDKPLERARTSAGFWNSELSPLGGAVLANVVATRGLRVTPRIVDEVRRPDGAVLPVVSPAPRRVLDRAVAADLAAMLERVVSKGTARKGFYTRRGKPYLGDIKVAGKTGSLSRTDPYIAYSWFVGFAPADKPKYVVSVLLGNPMKWHLKGHTAARLVLQKAFAAAK